MIHVVELAALLLLLCVGHGVVDVSPDPVRRIVKSYALWLLGMGAVIAVFSVPPLVVWVVRLAVVLAGVFAVRWVWGEFVDFWRGPHLIPEPSRRAFREAAHELGGFSRGACRRIARAISREHHPHIALLGLTRLSVEDCPEVEEFLEDWRRAAESALEEVRDIAARLAGAGKKPADARAMLLIAQALSLYEARSVERAVAAACEAGSRGRGARKAIVAYLGKSGKPSDAAKHFLMLNGGDSAAGRKAGACTVADILWPARRIARAGFPPRAAAFGVAFILLAAYGAFALRVDRASGWVYLAVALFIHIEAVFAVGDVLPEARDIGDEGAR